MNKLLNVSSSPHVRCSVNTQNLMLDVVIAMLPAAAFGVYNFGFHALLVLLVTSAVCVASEYVYEKLMHKPITIADGSALVTGMILALNMPPQIPVWVPALGGIFAIIVVKQLYGGLGQNFMNPALAARCFLLISFAGMMNNFSAASLGFDSVSGATPLAAMRAGQSVDLASMFIGRIPGTIGEVSTIALLIGGIYLLVRKVISWRIPVIYIGTVAVFVFIFGGFDVNYVLCQVCGGGLIFGAFFMATDYVTSPITPMGQIVFGVVLGLLTGIFRLSSSPHVRCSVNTQNLMLDVVIAMLPAAAFGVYNFGFHALLVLLVTSAVCVASEYVYEKLMHKPITIADGSALVTGMILALNMPPQIPVWVPALGGIFAIIVVKQLYGGLGQNFMNPALAARCFLLISFAGMMNNFSAASLGFDSVSGATPLAAMRAGQSVDLASMFIGRIPGTIGEVSTIALLIGGIYLLVRKVISWRIPVIYIGTVAVFVFIFGGFDVNYVLCQVCGGGLIFGAFFMATDYVTSPITPMGQIVFGVVLGLLTGIFRLWGASPEGVSYAIILSNLFVPMIERVTLPKAFGKEAKKA